MSFSRALPVFSAVFLIAYAIVMYFNLAPFSYYPQVGQLASGVAPASPTLGPAMYWYGWLSESFVIAAVVAAIAGFAPENFANRVAPVAAWLSVLAILFYPWVLRAWFIH